MKYPWFFCQKNRVSQTPRISNFEKPLKPPVSPGSCAFTNPAFAQERGAVVAAIVVEFGQGQLPCLRLTPRIRPAGPGVPGFRAGKNHGF